MKLVKYSLERHLGTLTSRKFPPHISRVFNFSIGEKNCVCFELNFTKLTIQCLYFVFITKITLINNCNKTLVTTHYRGPGQDSQFDDCTKDVLEELCEDNDSDAEEELEDES